MSDDTQQYIDNQSQSDTKQQKKVPGKRDALTHEKAHMRVIAFYFVIGFCSYAEITSTVAFFMAKSAEGALIFQGPALVCFYHLLCSLYPSKGATTNAFVALMQTFLKRKAP